jgi:hypothetical protein
MGLHRASISPSSASAELARAAGSASLGSPSTGIRLVVLIGYSLALLQARILSWALGSIR